jgi:hypothetical protein
MRDKLENYRIQEVVDANGDSLFFIERRGLFGFWYKWNHGIFGFLDKEAASKRIKSMCDVDCRYHNVE